jgi:hypothetical protein
MTTTPALAYASSFVVIVGAWIVCRWVWAEIMHPERRR